MTHSDPIAQPVLAAAVRAFVLMLSDALLAAEPAYWRRRAEAFDAARPRPGDYTGRLNKFQVAEQDARIAAKAQACRNRAELAAWTLGEREAETVLGVLDVIAAHRLDVARMDQVAA